MCSFFQKPFIVDLQAKEVFDQSIGIRCALGTGILILHYLTYAQNIKPSGHWITLKEIPKSGMIFYSAFKKEVMDTLAKTYQNDLAAFDKAAAALNRENLR